MIPVYNSEATLGELFVELSAVLPSCAERYEVIFVDDDSSDGSWEVVSSLARENDCVEGIRLGRNFGQHNATLCGIHAARYDVTVTMDDDLQHPATSIPVMQAKLDEGYDLVYGTAEVRAQSWYRNLGSKLLNRGLALAMRQPSVVHTDAFRAFRTKLRQASENYSGPRLLVDVLLGWSTTRIGVVPVPYNKRFQGRSNYSFGRLLEMTALAWTTYTIVPLRIAIFLGFMFFGFGAAVLLYVLAVYFATGSEPGFPFLASLIAIFGGAQLAFLGVVGEYLGNIFDRSLNRPVYVVQEMTAAASIRPLVASPANGREERGDQPA